MLALMTISETAHALLNMALFGVLGIALMLLGYKAFEWITPHLDVERELADKANVAVAIVVAAVMLGVAAIAVMAMM